MILQVSVDSSTNTLINRYVYNYKIVSFKNMLNELFIDSSVEYSHRRAQCPRRIQSNVR